eukprot:5133978-Pleurochrysis_carterae.AAC.1
MPVHPRSPPSLLSCVLPRTAQHDSFIFRAPPRRSAAIAILRPTVPGVSPSPDARAQHTGC